MQGAWVQSLVGELSSQIPQLSPQATSREARAQQWRAHTAGRKEGRKEGRERGRERGGEGGRKGGKKDCITIFKKKKKSSGLLEVEHEMKIYSYNVSYNFNTILWKHREWTPYLAMKGLEAFRKELMFKLKGRVEFARKKEKPHARTLNLNIQTPYLTA